MCSQGHLSAAILAAFCCLHLVTSAKNGRVEVEYDSKDQHKLNLYKSLMDPKKKKYVHFLSPAFTNVSLSLVLTDIIKVDIERGTSTLRIWVKMMWPDARLKWNPDDFGGLQQFTMPATKVWTPDIVPLNSVDPEFTYQLPTRVTISNDGSVIYVPSIVATFSFEVDKEKFLQRGNEVQRLVVKLGSWTQTGDEISVYSDTDKVDTSVYIPTYKHKIVNATWKINRITFDCCPAPHFEGLAEINVKLRDMD